MKKKILLVGAMMVLVALAAVGVTMAYLTSTDEAKNTFTVGNVKLTLDEAKVNPDGSAVENADRVKENSYKLMPGHTYVKDPTIHVDASSDDCYVFLKVTVGADLVEMMVENYNADKDVNAKLSAQGILKNKEARINVCNAWLSGINHELWNLRAAKVNEDGSVVVILGYQNAKAGTEVIVKGNNDIRFMSKFTVPGTVTTLINNNGNSLVFNAYAIQADGLDADGAYNALFVN